METEGRASGQIERARERDVEERIRHERSKGGEAHSQPEHKLKRNAYNAEYTHHPTLPESIDWLREEQPA